ncbi:MAG TPA: sugar phosphate isomerase/epimerase [Clostridiales bacterium]|nr:sugar phosphate isomerase/epimerase [Clostridiales bacterium]
MGKFILSAFADEIDQDLTVQMDVLEKHDINYIEMRGVNGKNIVEYSLDEVKTIKGKLDERGFKISAIGSPIGKIMIEDDFRPHLELFKHTLEIAKILETRYIRMFSFYIPNGEEASKYRDEVLSRWNRFVDAAKDTDIILLHENEKGIYGDTAERCLDLLENLDNKRVKAIFDPANFIQCDVETYPYAFELLRDYIEYMHIKDARFSDHEVVPSGKGDGKIKEILTELYNMGFEGFLSIEPHLANFVGFSELEKRDVGSDISDEGEKAFAIATHALKEILSSIESDDRYE